MTKIETFQNPKHNRKIASAQLNNTVFESMLRCAELNGYETVSDFVRDAILEKCENTAYAMAAIMKQNKSSVAIAAEF
jgi:SUMO ligase MMS21 Smc5/6 complex component